MRNTPRTGWTKRKREKFFQYLEDTGNVSKAARAVGHSRSRAYKLREIDEEFRQRWDDAIEHAVDAMEEEARRRAFEGIDKPIVYQGEIQKDKKSGNPVTIKEYSDTLLIFLLKGQRPEKYKDRMINEVTGKDGAPLTPIINVTIGNKPQSSS